MAYSRLEEKLVAEYVRKHAKDLPQDLQCLTSVDADLSCQELGDGNLNYVYRLSNGTQSLIVKQAVPFVRCVGEAWPLGTDRAYYDGKALVLFDKYCKGRVPVVYVVDREMATVVMEDLREYIILRKGIRRGKSYPCVASHIAQFMAKTLFKSCDFGMQPSEKRQLMAIFAGNHEIHSISDQVIFHEPYDETAKNNNWLKPELDSAVAEHFADVEKKIAARQLGRKFVSCSQSLIHGDLHTGSIMVTHTDTRVIDAEFAMLGPMGYDIGNVLAHLSICYRVSVTQDNDSFSQWILTQINVVWTEFENLFSQQWLEANNEEKALAEFLNSVWADTLGYCGTELTRRIVGVVTVEDLESMTDRKMRADCEKGILAIGRQLMVQRAEIKRDINAVCDMLSCTRR